MSGPRGAPGLLWVDATATASTRLRTGIQRVVRGLVGEGAHGSALPVMPAVWEGRFRPASPRERRRLGGAPGSSRREKGEGRASPQPGDRLLLPEILDGERIAGLRALLALPPAERPEVLGIAHDALSWTSPQWTPPERREGFGAYLGLLARCDRVLVPSAFTAEELGQAWREGAAEPDAQPPAPEICPWPVDASFRFREAGGEGTGGTRPGPGAPPVIACVGTLEARKNQGALLTACERLWEEGYSFRLELVGRQRARSERAWPDRIRELRRRGRPLRWRDRVGEADLVALYGRATFSVYPSLAEGFGLPIAESVACGCPCLCAGFGAMGEVAAGGGCRTLPAVTAEALATGLGELLTHPDEVEELRREAGRRIWANWADWIAGLPPASS